MPPSLVMIRFIPSNWRYWIVWVPSGLITAVGCVVSPDSSAVSSC